jgi:hypothetical protein
MTNKKLRKKEKLEGPKKLGMKEKKTNGDRNFRDKKKNLG